ncbi:MAG: glycoside hydrolase family 30 beta sandwich domain-containing protein [Sphingorhabdus sp.]|uniref:glycoside hydrolase family 30 protein n=1 Tax=Sphingorhabdus sp. TaxID=1902408 RepID=UPI003CBA2F68
MTPSLRKGCLLAAIFSVSYAAQTKSPSVEGWLTSADGSQRLAPMAGIVAIQLPAGQQADIIVDPKQRFQRMAGFGASITDATAWLIQTRMTEKARNELMRELFSPRDGIGFSVTRITIGASDFSQKHYTYADTPGNPVADIAPAREHLIPTLKTMRKINPGLQVIATPWSAPAWMKTSNSLIKGRLKYEHYGSFARYLVSYTLAMRKAGAPVDILTIQNEPHFEPDNYPGMRVEPAERAAFIANHLGPLMRRSLPGTKLLDWDHNWDQPESPTAVLSDAKAAAFVDGVAWHCYAGDVAAQSVVRDRFPSKEVWFTECASGNWSGDWSKSFNWTIRNLIIGSTRNWAKGVVMWNLALDEKHGPHLGGCGNCRGLVTINSQSGEVTREPEYYAFAHASRFVRAGSVRVSSMSADKAIESVAFQKGRNGPVTLIALNGSEAERKVTFAIGRKTYSATMSAGAVATFRIPAS